MKFVVSVQQYIYIYISLYKYLKGKKKHKPITEKKKKTIITAQNLEKKKWLMKPNSCSYSTLVHSCTSLIVKIL